MKKSISLFIALVLLLGVLPVALVAQAAAPGTYNPGDIAVINNIIDNNGLDWPKAPADGSSVPKEWDDWGDDEDIVESTMGVYWTDGDTDKRVYTLDISYRNLTGCLNLSGLDSMIWLECGINKLTALDLSGCSELSWVFCYDNKLTSLDASGHPDLLSLDCSGNLLTSLDVTGNPSLERLDCSRNLLPSLDVTDNPSLKVLYCSFSNRTDPYYDDEEDGEGDEESDDDDDDDYYDDDDDYYDDDDWTGSDRSKLAALDENKIFAKNKLTELDVSKNPQLRFLDCTYNYFASRSSIIGIEDVDIVYFDPQIKFELTVEGGKGSGKYTPFADVTIKAKTVENQVFDRWEIVSGDGIIADSKNPQTTFTMPESKAVVRAVYKDADVTTTATTDALITTTMATTVNDDTSPETGDPSPIAFALFAGFAAMLLCAVFVETQRKKSN